MGIGGWGWTSLESAWLGLDVGGVTYLLNVPFTGSDQGYADGQVLDTEAEGVQDGQLTVVEKDGTLAIVSNECAFTAQSTPVYGDLGLCSQGITKALGIAVLSELQNDANSNLFVGWYRSTTLVSGNAEGLLKLHGNDFYFYAPGYVPGLFTFADATEYEIAVVLGGYDANGVPWHSGEAAADYKYGTSLYAKGGTLSTWTLLWRDTRQNTATLYAGMHTYTTVGHIDNCRVPDEDLSAVLEPLVSDTFTDSNGTSLDAHDPEVDAEGGGWVEQRGDWDIQGNRGNATGADPGDPWWIAVLDSGVADCLVRETVNMASGGTAGLILRNSDEDNFWQVRPSTGDFVRIYEVNASSWTQRASAVVSINDSTDYDVVAIADGQDIVGFLDGANRIAYGSAALNETETVHGLWSYKATDEHENFHVHGRTGSVYDAEFDAV